MKPLLATAIAAVFFCNGVYANEDLTCMAVEPNFEFRDPENKRGFELIDLWQREVWATADWSEAEFKDLDLPLSYVFWRKNDTRVPMTTKGEFLKSPGCEVGQFSYIAAFDREFFQVVKLGSFVNHSDQSGTLNGVELEKYHRLTFAAGIEIQFLKNADGDNFIKVTEPVNFEGKPDKLPSGWTLQAARLTKDLVINLSGKVTVLRTENGVSYQGPVTLPKSSDFTNTLEQPS